MLTRLGTALGGWTPRVRGGDPLSLIRSAWPGLVGADVARAAAPVAIANDVLVIVTTSAAWSHELAFLEPQILRGLRELDLPVQVVRLRFRVGTIKATATASRVVASVARPKAGPSRRPAPRSTAEALARFRETVERARAQHAARGGRFCTQCAAPVMRVERCLPCREWARSELEAQCQRLLYDAPWLTPQAVLETLPGLDAAAYDSIRRRLLRSWWDEMALARKRAALPKPIAADRGRLRKIASSYVLLETKMDPNRLEMDSPIRQNALGDLYDFIRTVERGPQRSGPG